MVFGLLFGGCAKTGEAAEGGKEKETVILSAFVQQSVSTESGIWQGWAADRLYEDTGLRIDFKLSGTEADEKLKRYIASGTLPDIIGFHDAGQAQIAIDAGLLAALDDYKDRLPSIYGNEIYAQAVDYSMRYNGKEDGKLYIMPVDIGGVSEETFEYRPMFLWDSYEQAGYLESGVLEDYLDVIEAMMREKPITKYGKKVYGFSMFSDWDKYSVAEVAALGRFYGIDTQNVSSLMEANMINGRIDSVLSEDSFYKRALKFYFEANKRGLVDPDSRTQSYTNAQHKYNEGRVLFAWYSVLTDTYNGSSSGNVNNEITPDGYVCLPASDMKICETPSQTIGKNWYFAINKSSKALDEALDFLNWFYDPETIAYLYNGPEGVTWAYTQDGEPKVTDEGWKSIDQSTEDMTIPSESGSFVSGTAMFNTLGIHNSTIMEDGYTISYRHWPDSKAKYNSLLQQEVKEYLGIDETEEYLQQHDLSTPSTIAVYMVPTASDEVRGKEAVIGEIVCEYSWRAIFAESEAEFDSLWATMVSLAEEAGMEEVETYYKQAWQEAQTRAAEYTP